MILKLNRHRGKDALIAILRDTKEESAFLNYLLLTMQWKKLF